MALRPEWAMYRSSLDSLSINDEMIRAAVVAGRRRRRRAEAGDRVIEIIRTFRDPVP